MEYKQDQTSMIICFIFKMKLVFILSACMGYCIFFSVIFPGPDIVCLNFIGDVFPQLLRIFSWKPLKFLWFSYV